MKKKGRGRPRKVKIDSGKGLGDTIESVTRVTGIKKIVEVFSNGKDCGCEERKKKLNKLFSYKLKARCFTEQEYVKWGQFKNKLEETRMRVAKEDLDYLSDFYSDLFSVPRYEICTTCSGALSKAIKFIDNIDKVYDEYKKELKL